MIRLFKQLVIRHDYLFSSFSRYPLVQACACYWVQLVLLVEAGFWVACAFCFLCLIYCLLRRKYLWVSLGVVVFIATFLQIEKYKKVEPDHIKNFSDQIYTVYGEVENYPYEKNGKIVFDLQPKILIKNQQIVKISKGKIRVSVDKFFQVNKKNKLSADIFLETPPSFDGFDYKKYLETNEVFALGKSVKNLKVIESEEDFFTEKIQRIRTKLIESVRNDFSEPHAGLLLGILIGTREEFPGDFAQQLSATGTTHIIAVSGYNITVIIGMCLSLAGIIPRKIALIFTIFILILFITIVGTDNLPAMRATIMGVSVIIGMFIGRKSAVYSMLSVSVILLLISNPYVYKSLSFQLSFAATLGLILMADNIEKIIPSIISGGIREELAVTFSAIIATYPITFSKFGSINIWAPLANVIVAPITPIIMLFGSISAFCYLVFNKGFMVVNFLAWLFLDIMVRAIELISTFPYARIILEEHLGIVSIIFLLLIILYIFESNFRLDS